MPENRFAAQSYDLGCEFAFVEASSGCSTGCLTGLILGLVSGSSRKMGRRMKRLFLRPVPAMAPRTRKAAKISAISDWQNSQVRTVVHRKQVP